MSKFEAPPEKIQLIRDTENFLKILVDPAMASIATEISKDYPYWTDIKDADFSGPITAPQLWSFLKLQRLIQSRPLKISDDQAFSFHYNLTDQISDLLHRMDFLTGGGLDAPAFIGESEKEALRLSAMMEEAIASAQLSGAGISRKEAKELLRAERKPKTTSEQMIVNTYRTLQLLHDLKREELSDDLIFRIHEEIMRELTGKPDNERLFRNTNATISLSAGKSDVVLPTPEPNQLKQLLTDLYAFANSSPDESFLHPLIKASVLHYLVAAMHPFDDGNGRTARALYHWFLIKNGYSFFNYLAPSRIIRESPSRLDEAFHHVSCDENDLTYFILYQLRTMDLAAKALVRFVETKKKKDRQLDDFAAIPGVNIRQAMILKLISGEPQKILTVKEIQNRFVIAYQTARTDLMGLEEKGFLEMKIAGKKLQQYLRAANFEPLVTSLK